MTEWLNDPCSDVLGVVYKADTYCVPCGVAEYLKRNGLEGHGLSYVAQEALDLLGRFALGSAWRDGDEHEWDSGDFPKVILRFSGEDHPCGSCGLGFGR
jgi:hypothetical protein